MSPSNVILFAVFCVFSFVVSFSTLSGEPERLIISTFTGPPLSTSEGTGFADLIITQAFKRIGFAIEIIQLPVERSLATANSGKVDGEFVRVAGLERIYPNLIPVPEEIITFEFVAFTRHLSFRTERWESLAPYNVGIVIGWKILEENIVNTNSLIKLRNEELLFRLLDRERIDIAVYSRHFGLYAIKKLGLEGIRVLDPPLAAKPMFLYIHRKHLKIMHSLAMEIKEMKTDGSFASIRQKTLSSSLNDQPGPANE